LNNVDLTVNWKDGSSQTAPLQIQTDEFVSDHEITNMTINQQYENPQFGFLLIESTPASPIIMDLDGEVRWQSEIDGKSIRPVFFDSSGFLVGEVSGGSVHKFDFKGQEISSNDLDKRYANFHHNIENGKQGLLANISFRDGTVYKPESVLIEMTPKGTIINSWDFDDIVGGQIQAAGEDPSAFVQNGQDWFHMNSAIYISQDDSIIVSSRTSFVVKVDYSTKKIKWLLGNPAKNWYKNYPLSLQLLAMSIYGNAPIGQHALSVIGDPNHLLVFNNGLGDRSAGDCRTYSSTSLYEINESAMTASEVWTFDNNQTLYSPICGSAYKTSGGEYLMNFATVSSMTAARIMIVDENKNLKFDMLVPKRSGDTTSCDTVYRVKEINLDSLYLQ
jgi:arylsulfate sulfotransferase